MSYKETLLLILSLLTLKCLSSEIHWDHSVDLDDNFRLFWRVKEPDIIIEVQVKTQGYIGLGFARSEHIYGADMAVGWVDNKHTFFQVSLIFYLYFVRKKNPMVKNRIQIRNSPKGFHIFVKASWSYLKILLQQDYYF